MHRQHGVEREAWTAPVGGGPDAIVAHNRYQRLKGRYERRDDTQQALLDFGCALIC